MPEAEAGGAGDAADHLRAALPDLRRFDEALLIMATLPFALTGGIWLLYLLGYNLSVATGVGFIALAGVSAEFGVVMLIYPQARLADRGPAGRMRSKRRSAKARCCACGPRR
jgi:Cu(I)/Ag(I) efflux system membrane protein CusA/SilA